MKSRGAWLAVGWVALSCSAPGGGDEPVPREPIPDDPSPDEPTSPDDEPPGTSPPVERWTPTADVDELVGWATQPGPAGATTQGGLGGEEVWPASPDELASLAQLPESRVIHVRGDIRLSELVVGSNTTLLGGFGSTIHGSIVVEGSEAQPVDNVVIRNLKIDGSLAAAGVAMDIRHATNVWVDHCEIYDAEAGLLNVSRGSDLVTVSYNRFLYTPNAADPLHRLPVTVGHADSAGDTDEGHLRVTFHHNHWGDWIDQRSPRVRFGDVHVYNDLYDFVGNTYAIRAAYGSRLLVEANYFRGVHNAHQITFDDGAPAELLALGNAYEGTSGRTDADGSAFVPPYAYEPIPAEDVPAFVAARAGPR